MVEINYSNQLTVLCWEFLHHCIFTLLNFNNSPKKQARKKGRVFQLAMLALSNSTSDIPVDTVDAASILHHLECIKTLEIIGIQSPIAPGFCPPKVLPLARFQQQTTQATSWIVGEKLTFILNCPKVWASTGCRGSFPWTKNRHPNWKRIPFQKPKQYIRTKKGLTTGLKQALSWDGQNPLAEPHLESKTLLNLCKLTILPQFQLLLNYGHFGICVNCKPIREIGSF